MCEQLYEQSPDYFRKFAKNFRYTICESYPAATGSFAFAFHNPKSDACSIKNNADHWHLLTYTETASGAAGGYDVPCPYSCFYELIWSGNKITYEGDIFKRLRNAVVYVTKNPEMALGGGKCARKKRLPKVDATMTKLQAVQTDQITSNSLERYFMILNGPHGGAFSQIMDAFISGYGHVYRQDHSMVTNFELTCSQAQCYCYECTERIDDDDDDDN
jgi:hypothetical protein